MNREILFRGIRTDNGEWIYGSLFKMKFKDLLIEHDYYCSNSNYFSNEAAEEYKSWEDFYSEYKKSDICMNLIFRWDVYQNNENKDGRGIFGTYYASISMMKQTKGIFAPIIIYNIDPKDFEEIKEYLTLHYEYLKKLWLPFTNEMLKQREGKMTKIKFKLVKFEKALAFQILEMDERFRWSKNKPDHSYTTGFGLEIKSVYCPLLSDKIIGLRGTELDNDLIIINEIFSSNYDRDVYFTMIIYALKCWAENWPGFKDDQEIQSETEADVYEF